MKILIDPVFVNPWPGHLLPRFLGLPVDRVVPPRLWRSRFWIGPFPHWAFGPDGFDAMDLGMTYTYLFRSDLSLRSGVAEAYRSSRWPIRAFHATFAGEGGFFQETGMNLASPEARNRRGLANHIRAAAEIGGPGSVLVIHPGTVQGGGGRPEAMDALLRNLEGALPAAEQSRVVLALENMPRSMGRTRYLGSDYGELRAVLDALPSDSLKVCLDVGHANNYGEIHARNGGGDASEAFLRGFGYCREVIRELGHGIVYAHVHYNRSHLLREQARRRNFDEHMPLSKIPGSCWEAFRETLCLLLRETAVPGTGWINLELAPARLFGCYKVMPMGSGLRDQMASVRLFREVLEACLPGVTRAESGPAGRTA